MYEPLLAAEATHRGKLSDEARFNVGDILESKKKWSLKPD